TGIDMEVRSDAPAGSGLGGASALTTAIAGGLAALQGTELRSSELAELCYAIEREDAGVVGGKQDQYAAAYGGFNLLEFCGAGGGGYLLLACAPERQGNVRHALESEGGQFASFAFVPEGVRATRDGEPWAPLDG